jgi:hypothetical protein
MEAYILGLWLGDKYWRSSSIGLTNTNEVLIAEFRKFLKRNGFSRDRIKLSVYTKSGRANRTVTAMKHKIPERNVKVYKLKKGVNPVFIIYVNSRKLKRKFDEVYKNLENLVTKKNIFEYLGGRFDSDGNYIKPKNRLRISYTTRQEASRDALLVANRIGIKPKVKFYKKANEWILEMSGKKWRSIIEKILIFSRLN